MAWAAPGCGHDSQLGSPHTLSLSMQVAPRYGSHTACLQGSAPQGACEAPAQTVLRLYIWWRSFWASSSVDRSMPATWHDSRAYAGGPSGSHE